MTKNKIRYIARNKRDSMPYKDKIIKDQTIVSKIEQYDKYINAIIIGSYVAINSEVNVSSLNKDKSYIAYPVVKGEDMDFIIPDKNTSWKKNSFGVSEPTSGVNVNNKIDLLIVPSLAKNKDNYRLGYGKGYYDKFIKKYKPKHTLGVIYSNMCYDFKEDIWDIALDDYVND